MPLGRRRSRGRPLTACPPPPAPARPQSNPRTTNRRPRSLRKTNQRLRSLRTTNRRPLKAPRSLRRTNQRPQTPRSRRPTNQRLMLRLLWRPTASRRRRQNLVIGVKIHCYLCWLGDGDSESLFFFAVGRRHPTIKHILLTWQVWRKSPFPNANTSLLFWSKCWYGCK